MHSGKELQLLRIMKNLSQEEVALRLDISQQSISKWEKMKQVDAYKINRFLVAIKATRKELEEIKKVNH